MSQQYVHLIGAEQVQTAANTMQSAAHDMRNAACTIEDSLQRHRIYLDEWLCRFEQALAEKGKA